MKKTVFVVLMCMLFSVSAKANVQSPIAAYPTTVKVVVNGSEIDFDSYTINERTYFKLRDVAFCVSGSKKQFDVKWDEETEKIHIFPGAPYTIVGGEMKINNESTQYANMGADGFYIGDEWLEISAYEINWNNYYHIRMLGEILDFEVFWNDDESTVVIDSHKGYTGAMPEKEVITFYEGFDDVPDAGGVFGKETVAGGTENIDNRETRYYGYCGVDEFYITEYQKVLGSFGFRQLPCEIEKVSMYANEGGRAVYTSYDNSNKFFFVYIPE